MHANPDVQTCLVRADPCPEHQHPLHQPRQHLSQTSHTRAPRSSKCTGIVMKIKLLLASVQGWCSGCPGPASSQTLAAGRRVRWSPSDPRTSRPSGSRWNLGSQSWCELSCGSDLGFSPEVQALSCFTAPPQASRTSCAFRSPSMPWGAKPPSPEPQGHFQLLSFD